MKIAPYLDNGNWILARNLHEVPKAGASGTRSQSAGQLAYDGCWTGERWAGQGHFAKKFDTSEEAVTYLHEHREEMEAAPG